MLAPVYIVKFMFDLFGFQTKLVTYTKQVQSGQELVEKEQEVVIILYFLYIFKFCLFFYLTLPRFRIYFIYKWKLIGGLNFPELKT